MRFANRGVVLILLSIVAGLSYSFSTAPAIDKSADETTVKVEDFGYYKNEAEYRADHKKWANYIGDFGVSRSLLRPQ